MADERIVRTVNCIETLKAGHATLREEQFNNEDLTDFVDLFPEYAIKVSSIFHFLNGDLSINMDDDDEEEEEEKEDDDEENPEEGRHYSRKGVTYNRMTKLDAENICKYIATKCRGRGDLPAIINDVYEYINGKFNKASIRDILYGRTWTTISQNYFKISKGKVKAI